MKYLKIVIDHLKRTCVYFTVAQLFIAAGAQIFTTTDLYGTNKGSIITFETEIILLAFSVAMALIQDVFRIKKLSFAVKLIIHFFLTMIAFFLLTVLLDIKSPDRIKTTVTVMFLAAIFYALVAVAVIIIRVIRNKREEKNKEYTPMFKGKNK